MTLNSEIAEQIKEIGQDKIHGASWLSRRALGVMNLAIEKSEAKKVAIFLEELKEVGRELGEGKPSMASITNSVSRLVYEISQESKREKDLAALKSLASSMGNKLIEDSEENFRKATLQGAEVVEMGDRLMTCSYSSTICEALRIARLRGENFHVLVAESRFGGKAYGEIAANELESYGIEAEVVSDSAISDRMSTVNKALVGADSLLSDGSLVNGTPTHSIAWAARECQLPFYSLCETAKFDARSYLGRPGELEEGFDRVPSHLITKIITEEGIAKPDEVVNYIKEMAGWVRTLFQS